MQVHWLFQQFMLDRVSNHSFPTMQKAAVAHDFNHHVAHYEHLLDPLDDIPFEDGSTVVTWGTHQFVRAVIEKYASRWNVVSYFKPACRDFQAFASRYGALMLNDDFMILPFGEIARRRKFFAGSFFIKPLTAVKAFTGFVITEDQFDHEISSLRQIQKIDDDMLCVISSPKDIDCEFRFVIVDGGVVTGSEYRWHNVLDVRTDVHPLAQAMAEKIAAHPWQPDRVYVCDIALINDLSEARVIELNAFSTSGLYACDTNAIVQAVSAAAWNEATDII